MIMTINKDTGILVYKYESVVEVVSYKQSVRFDEDDFSWVDVLTVEQRAISDFINWLLLYDWLNFLPWATKHNL